MVISFLHCDFFTLSIFTYEAGQQFRSSITTCRQEHLNLPLPSSSRMHPSFVAHHTNDLHIPLNTQKTFAQSRPLPMTSGFLNAPLLSPQMCSKANTSLSSVSSDLFPSFSVSRVITPTPPTDAATAASVANRSDQLPLTHGSKDCVNEQPVLTFLSCFQVRLCQCPSDRSYGVRIFLI